MYNVSRFFIDHFVTTEIETIQGAIQLNYKKE